jgi:hypothetical protein
MNVDLGTEDKPLMLTAAAWVDPKVADGKAEWHPFRDPDEVPIEEAAAPDRTRADAVAGDAPATLTPADPETAKAIRELIEDYNTDLADSAYDTIGEYYEERQATAVGKLITTLPALTAKLTALSAAAPDQSEKLAALVSKLSLASVLKIEIGAISTSGPKQAVAELKNAPALAFIPGMDAEIPREIRFQYGDDEYWYISSPIVTALEKIEPSLSQGVSQLDAVIAAAGSGDADGAIQSNGLLNGMLNSNGAPAGADTAPAEQPDAAGKPDEAGTATGAGADPEGS